MTIKLSSYAEKLLALEKRVVEKELEISLTDADAIEYLLFANTLHLSPCGQLICAIFGPCIIGITFEKDDKNRKNNEAIINDVINSLTPIEAKVLRMRFGIEMSYSHSLEEVGNYLGLSQTTIKKIETTALRKMRHPSRSNLISSIIEPSTPPQKIEDQVISPDKNLQISLTNHAIENKFVKQTLSFSSVNLMQGSKEWDSWRKNGIGGSDAPVIMNENPWKSASYLLKEKLSNVKIWRGNKATQAGQTNEPVIRNYLIKKLGFEISPICIQCNEISWMRASLDGLSLKGDRVFEIKFGDKVYSYVSENKQAPQYHFGQLQHILAITGHDYIDYCCATANKEPIHLQIPRDDEYIDRLIQMEYLFWKKVIEKK